MSNNEGNYNNPNHRPDNNQGQGPQAHSSNNPYPNPNNAHSEPNYFDGPYGQAQNNNNYNNASPHGNYPDNRQTQYPNQAYQHQQSNQMPNSPYAPNSGQGSQQTPYNAPPGMNHYPRPPKKNSALKIGLIILGVLLLILAAVIGMIFAVRHLIGTKTTTTTSSSSIVNTTSETLENTNQSGLSSDLTTSDSGTENSNTSETTISQTSKGTEGQLVKDVQFEKKDAKLFTFDAPSNYQTIEDDRNPNFYYFPYENRQRPSISVRSIYFADDVTFDNVLFKGYMYTLGSSEYFTEKSSNGNEYAVIDSTYKIFNREYPVITYAIPKGNYLFEFSLMTDATGETDDSIYETFFAMVESADYDLEAIKAAPPLEVGTEKAPAEFNNFYSLSGTLQDGSEMYLSILFNNLLRGEAAKQYIEANLDEFFYSTVEEEYKDSEYIIFDADLELITYSNPDNKPLSITASDFQLLSEDLQPSYFAGLSLAAASFPDKWVTEEMQEGDNVIGKIIFKIPKGERSYISLMGGILFTLPEMEDAKSEYQESEGNVIPSTSEETPTTAEATTTVETTTAATTTAATTTAATTTAATTKKS